METNYKITIPKPCHEDWNAMTPDETGRFCNSCAKSVVDFTGMKATDIQDYFIKNRGQNVCGRFKTEQLDSIIIQIPREVLFSQVQFHKIFMLALLICMGTTLFSCQSDGHKKKIDSVTVVDSTGHGMATGGAGLVPNTTKTDSVSTPKKLRTKGEVILTGDVTIAPENPDTNPPIKKEFYSTNELETMPSYPGGLTKFYEYFTSNFKLSEADKKQEGRIILSFIIEKDGSLSTFKMLRGFNEKISNQAIEVLKTSPKWNAGEMNGEKVRTLFTLPIKITAQE